MIQKYDFKTEVIVNCDGDLANVDYRDARAVVRWRLDLSVRSWGIESIVAEIPEQKISYFVEIETLDEQEYPHYHKEVRTVVIPRTVISNISELNFSFSNLNLRDDGVFVS